jgi:hypothetical protein
VSSLESTLRPLHQFIKSGCLGWAQHGGIYCTYSARMGGVGDEDQLGQARGLTRAQSERLFYCPCGRFRVNAHSDRC